MVALAKLHCVATGACLKIRSAGMHYYEFLADTAHRDKLALMQNPGRVPETVSPSGIPVWKGRGQTLPPLPWLCLHPAHTVMLVPPTCSAHMHTGRHAMQLRLHGIGQGGEGSPAQLWAGAGSCTRLACSKRHFHL